MASSPSSTRSVCAQRSHSPGAWGHGFSGQYGSLAASRSASTTVFTRARIADGRAFTQETDERHFGWAEHGDDGLVHGVLPGKSIFK